MDNINIHKDFSTITIFFLHDLQHLVQKQFNFKRQ